MILVALCVARVASADPSRIVRREFQAGIDAFRLGKLAEARAHLDKARSLDPALPGPYRFLAAVAQAESRWPDCIEAAHTALERNPRSTEAADTRALYERCRAAAGRPAYHGQLGDSAAISVVTSEPGATVKVRGLTYGGTPLAPHAIPAGIVTLDVTKAGWQPVRVEVHALAGLVTDVSVVLEPAPAKPR